MEDQHSFSFEKKIGIPECLHGDIPALLQIVRRLLYCLKETNTIHNTSCEFFRLDFRTMNFDEDFCREFPINSLVLDMKWGSKKELQENKKE